MITKLYFVSTLIFSKKFQQILEQARKTIDASVIFIDGELKDGSEPLDQMTKKKKPKNSMKAQQQDNPKSMHVSIFVPFVSDQLVHLLSTGISINFCWLAI